MAKTANSTRKNSKSPAKKKRKSPQPQQRGTWREIMGIACITVGIIFLYFILMGTSGAGLAVANFLRGIAGALRIVIPVVFCWAGILLMFSGRSRSIEPKRVALMALIPLFIATLVHVYYAEDIIATQMQVFNYANFLTQSYAYEGGGTGIIGAVLTWPLYWSLSLRTVGSTIVLIFMILADLVLMGKVSLRAVGERVHGGYEDYRERYTQYAAERAEIRSERDALRISPTLRISQPSEDDFELWDEPEPEPPKKRGRKTVEPEISPIPREMHIERITSDDKFPGGSLPSVVENDEPYEEDIPLFLTAADRARKKKKAQPDPVRIKEPEDSFRRAEAPASLPLVQPTPRMDDEPFDILPPVEAVLEEDYNHYDEPSDTMETVEMDFGLEDDLSSEILEETEPDEILNHEQADEVEAVSFKEPAFDMPSLRRAVAEAAKTPPEVPDVEPYNYPPIDLLEPAKPSKVRNQEQQDAEKAAKLIETLASFGISVSLLGIAHGPTVTRFEVAPGAGIKVSRITSLADDIALNLAAVSVRIEAPIPGKAAVGVEVPNEFVETVPLRDVLESSEARKHPSRIAAAFGRDNAGRNIVADLAKMPHVLIAGATGAGKSVCINCIICSILYRATPEEVRVIMIDPKVVELSVYNGIPHLLIPVVTDPKKASSALDWAVNEMTNRYKKFAESGVRDIKGYNQHRPEGEPLMPQIVIIIDELADLMMVTPGEVEDAICRLAQLARAAGIHLVIATQRPSVNVITGVIKANIPSRIAFTVASQVDSRTILDVGGAEKLLGRGDMLFAPAGTNKPVRVQGAWVSEDEVHEVVDYIRVRHDAAYDEDIMEHMNSADMSDEEKQDAAEEYDDLLPQAIETVIDAGQASISMLQRKLRVGYARAGRLIDEMAMRGIVSQSEGAKPRNVLITREQFRTMFDE